LIPLHLLLRVLVDLGASLVSIIFREHVRYSDFPGSFDSTLSLVASVSSSVLIPPSQMTDVPSPPFDLASPVLVHPLGACLLHAMPLMSHRLPSAFAFPVLRVLWVHYPRIDVCGAVSMQILSWVKGVLLIPVLGAHLFAPPCIHVDGQLPQFLLQKSSHLLSPRYPLTSINHISIVRHVFPSPPVVSIAS
jgi:hypothetical protein